MPMDPYLETAQEFIDFINQQVGVYNDALSGFSNNKIAVERQIMRIRRNYPSVDEKGNRVMMSTSFEDPSKPDVIQFRILKATDFINENSPSGLHEQQLGRGIIIFLYTFWEDEIRPRLAIAKGVEKNEIKSDVMNDLRILRHAILHDKATLNKKEHAKLVRLAEYFRPDAPVTISHETMHKTFIAVKQEIGRFVIQHMGQENGPLKPEEIKDIAIQLGGRRTPKGKTP